MRDRSKKFRGVKIDDFKTTVSLLKHRDRGHVRNFRFYEKRRPITSSDEGRVFNRRRAFDRFACIDAHPCQQTQLLTFAINNCYPTSDEKFLAVFELVLGNFLQL
jgi:hypothetical protein